MSARERARKRKHREEEERAYGRQLIGLEEQMLIQRNIQEIFIQGCEPENALLYAPGAEVPLDEFGQPNPATTRYVPLDKNRTAQLKAAADLAERQINRVLPQLKPIEVGEEDVTKIIQGEKVEDEGVQSIMSDEMLALRLNHYYQSQSKQSKQSKSQPTTIEGETVEDKHDFT